jgi:hypothetical protein
MTPQERHEDVVRRYPGGLTPAQFRHEALASVDADGKLDPPALADWFKAQSLLISMWMDGLIERRARRDEPGPWFITHKGRGAMVQASTGADNVSPGSDEQDPCSSAVWDARKEKTG